MKPLALLIIALLLIAPYKAEADNDIFAPSVYCAKIGSHYKYFPYTHGTLYAVQYERFRIRLTGGGPLNCVVDYPVNNALKANRQFDELKNNLAATLYPPDHLAAQSAAGISPLVSYYNNSGAWVDNDQDQGSASWDTIIGRRWTEAPRGSFSQYNYAIFRETDMFGYPNGDVVGIADIHSFSGTYWSQMWNGPEIDVLEAPLAFVKWNGGSSIYYGQELWPSVRDWHNGVNYKMEVDDAVGGESSCYYVPHYRH